MRQRAGHATPLDMQLLGNDAKHDDTSGKNMSRQTSKQRASSGLVLVCILIFTIEPLSRGRVSLPSWILKPVVAAGIVYLGYKLLTFRRWADENRWVLQFLACFLAMLLELTWENGMVWMVSWSDIRKYDNVPGLQDNVQLLAESAARSSPTLHAVIYNRWCNILHFLCAMLAMALSVLWDQVPYSGFRIMSRVTLCIAASRVLRVASFMCTVLPNPVPGCYLRRFPPPPATLWETIRAGYSAIRGFGGCNDLVFSGHAAYWVLVPLMYRTYSRRYGVGTLLLWAALAHACLSDVVYGQHYSVDMLLAVVVTWAVWTWLHWLCPEEETLPPRPKGAPRDKMNPAVLALVCTALATGIGGLIIGKA